VPLELVVNEDNGEPYDESTYRHWVSTARAVAVFGLLARDTVRQAIVRAERLMAELIRTVDGLFARFPLDEENKARLARAVDQRARALAEWLDVQAARDSNGDEAAWRLKPCPSLMFVNGAGELDQKHDQDLRDTCVMLLDRAGCDLLTICDITGALVPKRADHREALSCPQCRSRRYGHRSARIAGAQGRDEGLIADQPNLTSAAARSAAICCGIRRICSGISGWRMRSGHSPWRAAPPTSQCGVNVTP
jgi:hypothetical protein